MEFFITTYNTSGFIALLIAALVWSVSHFAFVKHFKNLDFFLRVIGFIAFVAIFFLSGWKAGLIAIPAIFLTSIIGALLAKQFRA